MSREQMRKLLSESTNEELLQAENEELHRIAEQATERGMKAEAELTRLREDYDEKQRQLAAWMSQDMKHQTEIARLRVEADERSDELDSAHAELTRLREDNDDLDEGLKAATLEIGRLREALETIASAQILGVSPRDIARNALEEKP